METQDLIHAKADLRKIMRAILAQQSKSERQYAGLEACGHIVTWFKKKWPKGPYAVALFENLIDEISTHALDEYLMKQGIDRFVPLVHESHSLFVKLALKEDVTRLESGTCFIGSDIELDVIFVPGLAFDRNGHRLGRGKGYYDRALSQLAILKKPVIVGLAMDEQIVPLVPCEEHDVAMDYLCTPKLGMIKIA